MKIYLSRSTTRSMMADYPIGDPTGGPAYGEKRDPISAVISIASMAGTYATAGSFAAMTMFQGITFAGAALSLIGNVTGNKTLSQIGMIAGIAGGVGAFADSVMGGAPTGGTLGDFGKSSVSLEEVFRTPANGLTPVVDGVQSVDLPSPMTAQPLGGASSLNTPDASLLTPPAASAPAPAPASAGAGAPLTGGAAPIGIPKVESQFVKPNYALNGTNQGLRMGTGAPSPVGKPEFLASLKEGKFGDAAMAAGSGAMGMLKDNPTGAYVAAQAIGAGVDYLSGKTDAELDQLKASTGYANAKALEIQTALDREKARRANINASYANVNAGIKVKPPGLVASAMQST